MDISEITKQYWAEEDQKNLHSAESPKEMFVIVSRILSRMPNEPIAQVCGPINTGGLGSAEANLNAFNIAIKNLQSQGKNVFDQMPFEEPMQKIKAKSVAVGEYFEAVLTDFYKPLFESGKIKSLYFIQGWESSKGACWEHDQAKRLGIEIFYL